MAVSDFAVPVPRVGSIEAHSGYGRSSEEGLEIHRRIQASRAEEDPDYEAEQEVSRDFALTGALARDQEGVILRVSGRMDGCSRGSDGPLIEEIKSTFNLDELERKLNPFHPYVLQLRTYGYFWLLEHSEEPELRLLLVSSRTGERREVTIELEVDSYREWLAARLAELEDEILAARKRISRRHRTSERLAFPFESPRAGQRELIARIEGGFAEGRRLLLQAPTGLGKTMGVLYPALKESLSRGQRVVYATPKNSQHAVAEEAVERLQEQGAPLRSLTVTAKSKLCFKAEPLCNPEYCEYARDHYTKLSEKKAIDTLSKKKKFSKKTFEKLGQELEVCPFELQFEAVPFADVVICDYNYVISPRGSQGRVTRGVLGEQGKPNLVMDEAHNLPARGMDAYSPTLSSQVLEALRAEAESLPKRFRAGFRELLDESQQVILDCRPEGKVREARIQPPFHPFLDQEVRIRSFLSRYLESDVEIRPKDPVLRLSSYWSDFTAALEFVAGGLRPEFFTTYRASPSGGSVTITCCDASAQLKPCFDSFEQVVAFSATLKPFDYYAKLSGLESESLLREEFASPFDPANRKLLIVPQVTTRFSERSRQAPRIAEAIARIASVRRGNYLVFFPSFAFLQQVLETFRAPEGFSVREQKREMRADDVAELLEDLRSGEEALLVFAVQGGVLSEGVDYPGEMVIGAFVVGPPLPVFDLEREEMRRYYEKEYAAGFDYAYTFPAMAKAIQAAGRVIRTETDRGLVVLLDSRFLEPAYAGAMPADWFSQSPSECVSSSILEEVRKFWESGSA